MSKKNAILLVRNNNEEQAERLRKFVEERGDTVLEEVLLFGNDTETRNAINGLLKVRPLIRKADYILAENFLTLSDSYLDAVSLYEEILDREIDFITVEGDENKLDVKRASTEVQNAFFKSVGYSKDEEEIEGTDVEQTMGGGMQ